MTRVFKRGVSVVTASLFILLYVLSSFATTAFADDLSPDKQTELIEQTLTAAVYSDGSYSQLLDDQTEITLSGAMPKGAEVKAYPVSGESEQPLADDEPQEESEPEDGRIVLAYDISIIVGGEEFEPDGDPITVTFRSQELEGLDMESLSAVHIGGDGEEEEITGLSVDGNTLSLEAPSFSVYVIRTHENEAVVEPRLTFHFLDRGEEIGSTKVFEAPYYTYQNDVGDAVCTQIVKDGDFLIEPPSPPPIYDEDRMVKYRFFGWYVVDYSETSGDNIRFRWREDEAARINFTDEIDISEFTDDLTNENTDIYLAALYQNTRFVVFHEDQIGGENVNRIAQKKIVAMNSTSEDASTRVIVSDVSAPLQNENQEYFCGWVWYDKNGTAHECSLYNDQGESEGKVDLPVTASMFQKTNVSVTYRGNTYTRDVNDSSKVDLFPIYRVAYWLHYNTNAQGNGALYVPSRFVLSSTSVTSLPVTNMRNYTFLGWFDAETGGTKVANADGSFVSNNVTFANGKGHITNNELVLEENITLYAHWQATASASYKVVYWFENPDDGGYSFGSSATYNNQTPGQQTNVNPSSTPSVTVPNGENKNGFHLYGSGTYASTETDSRYKFAQKTIANDNSTVVNVYYKRNLYDVKFYRNSGDEYTSLGITAKYGADIHTLWPSMRGDYPANWYVNTSESTMQSSITTMPYNGAEFYYCPESGTNTLTTNYLTQNVDGSNRFTLYSSNSFKSGSSGIYTTIEEYIPIKGFLININPNGGSNSQQNSSIDAAERTYDTSFNVSDDMGTNYTAPNYTINIYYLRRQYTIRFNVNDDNQTETAIPNVYYQQDISSMALSGYVANETEKTINNQAMVFQGWYDNPACAGDPYDFTGKIMPAHDLTLYAKWEEKYYLAKIDPNGGVLNDGDSTWFYPKGGTYISEYTTTRDYIQDDSGTYRYLYEEYTPERDYYSDSYDPTIDNTNYKRRAKYVQSSESSSCIGQYLSTETYKYEPNAYTFKGWYRVVDEDTGEIDVAPYNFGTPVSSDTTLKAVWRRSGSYYIRFMAENQAEGTDGKMYTITGNVSEIAGQEEDTIYEPDLPQLGVGGFNDKAVTYTETAPEDPHVVGDAANMDWTFEGWRVYVGDSYVSNYFSPGNSFNVDSKWAETLTINGNQYNVITFKAEYAAKDQSFHIPETTALYLDGNSYQWGNGQLVSGSIPSNDSYYGSYTAGQSGLPAGLNNGVYFTKHENNFDVRLIKYGDRYSIAHYPQNGERVFSSADGYMLLGWDPSSDPNNMTTPYIPKFYTDGVIGIDHDTTKVNVLYALWEPMVYLTFDNTTSKPLEFTLDGVDTNALSIVNVYEGVYRREKLEFEDASTHKIKVAAGQSLKLVLPKGVNAGASTGQTFTINGAANQLDEGKRLVVQTAVPQSGTVTSRRSYSETFSATGTLVKDQTGVVVTFSEENQWKLNLEVNGGTLPAGAKSTIYFDKLTYVNQLPVPTLTGYLFAGWKRVSDSQVFPAGNITGSSIFVPPETLEQTLQATWKAENVTVPIRYFVRDTSGNLTEYRYNDSSFWDSNYYPPQNLNIGTSSVDIASELAYRRYYSTYSVINRIKSSNSSYKSISIGIGNPSNTLNSDVELYDTKTFNNANTSSPKSGGSYVKNTYEGLKWSSDDSNWQLYDDSAIYVIFSKVQTVYLTVKAETTGAMADPNQEYSYTVKYTNYGNAPSKSNETFQLKGGETKVIDLTYSSQYNSYSIQYNYQSATVTQTAVSGYTTTLSQSGSNGTINQSSLTYTFSARKSTSSYNYNTDTTVTFTNNRPAVTPTDYSDTSPPFKVMFAIGAAAVCAVPAEYRRRRGKSGKEREEL